MNRTRLILLAVLLALLAFMLLPVVAFGQTSGQWVLQQKNAGAGFTLRAVTGVNNRAFGLDSSGNLAMLSISGGAGLTNLESAITGGTLTLGGTLTTDRTLTVRDLAGTIALTSDLSAYLTTTTAASTYQPLDADLTSISGLTTTTFGRSMLTQADASATRTTLGLGTLATQSGTISDYLTTATAATTYQPLDADLTSIAALTTTSFGRDLLTQADASATRTTLELGQGDGVAFASLSLMGIGTGIQFTHSDGMGGALVTSQLLPPISSTGYVWRLPVQPSGEATLLSTDSDLNGSNITSGTVAAARLGSGTSISTKFLRGDNTWQTISGGGDALTTSPLSQFAATTSAQLRGVLTDESGTGEFLTTNGSAANLTSFPTLNQNTTGNAATATALETARNINGTSFNGTADITIAAAAGTLTGTTLAANVVSSSLTSVGTISSGTWQGSIIAPAYLGTGTSISTKFLRGDGTWQTISGGGDALTTSPLSQFAATTSAQFAGVISDETGTGSVVLASSPTLTTPNLGTPSTLTLTNATGLPLSTGITGTLPLANGGFGASLTDPNADRIPFWDDSAGTMTWLEVGSGLSISGTTITATGGGGGGIILQAAQTVDTTNRSIATTTMTASGVECVLPNNLKDTSSRVRIRVSGVVGASAATLVYFTLYTWDGSTATDLTPSGVSHLFAVSNASGTNSTDALSFEFVHTPGSTTPLTYRLYWSAFTSTTGYLGRRGADTLIDAPTIMTVEELD